MLLKLSPLAIVLMGWSAVSMAGNETGTNNYFGNSTGLFLVANTSNWNSFLGAQAGYQTSTGTSNSIVGYQAGFSNTSGGSNTLVGSKAYYTNSAGTQNTVVGTAAGYSSTGSGNVFIGFGSGNMETGSNRLYIDNCFVNATGACTSPLIYGEFDTRKLRIAGQTIINGTAALNGMTEVHNSGQAKSQLNFSQSSTDTGGYLTSVQDNNFFMSSGARFDGTLTAPNQWVQRSLDGQSVIQGSGGTGYRIFTSSGKNVNVAFNPTLRLQINYNGEVGINIASVTGHEIHTSSGAYLAGGTWTNASSRALKENIHTLTTEEATKALVALDPVKFNYKSDASWQHVGFIAEDVPDLVAAPDRKGLSAMDVVAVLTKVVQDQRQAMERQEQALQEKGHMLDEQTALLHAQRQEMDSMKAQLLELAGEMRHLRKGD
jgi:hypothetical protein